MRNQGPRSRLGRRRLTPRWGDSLAPLLDVIFLLVIFLLVSARFDQTRTIIVDLPEAKGTVVQSSSLDPLVLLLLEDGSMRWRGDLISPSQLTDQLTQFPPEQRLRPFTVQADRGVPLESGIQLLEMLRLLGWSQVEFEVSGTPDATGFLEDRDSEG
ncbi:MAG: biopolymer transporter ExbD [Planctomycetes bacterium]|jgi:biopolymer transport protein ExbD|nr:biopolymer transporter ExbD [Planctomycetota bacterium]MBT6452568.1 biopolymer transporter ExbD [Planctomycetota bacterium]MBT6540239.1 biopolymer transporter ExbD [Planctomycetota bacterium]MBT6783311.1 biopolymer transporter ExbD [Planctomycetota bacterium]MBT6969186.1 biopolymer transporter ExbD [Planctomycetota bacterium]